MLSLDEHRRADRLRTPLNHPALVFLRTRGQQQVQFLQIPNLRHWHQMIPPKLPAFAFHAAFLMSLARRAELRLEPPVRTESNEPCSLLPLMSPQDFLSRTLQVVVTQYAEHPAKISECQLVRFQECLLVGMWIGPMKCAAARHAAQAKQACLARFTVELRPAFIPIHLPLVTPRVRLRHEGFQPQ